MRLPINRLHKIELYNKPKYNYRLNYNQNNKYDLRKQIKTKDNQIVPNPMLSYLLNFVICRTR